MWSSRVDLPEPDTPERQTNRRKGSEKVSACTLCLVAFSKRSQGPSDLTGRREAGSSTSRRPDR